MCSDPISCILVVILRPLSKKPASRGLARRERGLRRGQARDGHAEWRARDVVEARVVAETDGPGLAAMLAADAGLESGFSSTSLAHREPNELTHAHRVQHLERILGQDTLVDVKRQESPGVVA